jgi:uncharacterized membrane protein (UPF0182 family)
MQSDPPVADSRKSLENTATVTFGNLLTLPVGENGLLYVVPMYAQAKGTEATFPRLIRVVVSYNNQVGYATTVGEALDQVGIDPGAVTPVPGANPTPATDQPAQTEQPSTPSTGNGSVPASPQRDEVVGRLNDALTRMQNALKNGDFTAYGQAQTDLLRATQDYENLPTS